MAKSYRPWSPHQSYLLPPTPAEWLPEGHLAFFVLEVVESLDLRAIEVAIQVKDPRGERPYAPRMLTALLLYGYAAGVFSSRRIARGTYEDVAMRVIAAGEHPHFTTVNQFRLEHREALAGLFLQVLRLCQSAGLVKLGHVAIDGSKVKANASKHKAMSYERMKKKDAQLSAEIASLLDQADAADAAEDAQYGVGQEPQDLPAELQRREGRRAKIRAALAALEDEAAQGRATDLRDQADSLRAKAANPFVPARQRKTAATLAGHRDQQALKLDPRGRDDDDKPPPGPGGSLPRHHPPTKASGEPEPSAQRNFTDPESRIMRRDGAFIQGYNVQLAVDEAHQIIVAEALTNQPPDVEHFGPMLDRIIDNCGAAPEHVTADAGYFSEGNVRIAEMLGSEPFIAVDRHRRDATDAAPSLLPTPARQRMRAVLAHPRGRAIYARRKCTVEPVFGQIFAARGFRQFLLRSLDKVPFEWTFLSLTHNLLKLFRASSRGRLQPA